MNSAPDHRNDMPRSTEKTVERPGAKRNGFTGNREKNKRDKLQRIRQAARDIFIARGFDGANVREIAAAADVALGTLFLYARDKQDLLLLIFEEDLPDLREEALNKVNERAPFIDQLMTFFEAFYEYFGANAQLSRDMLREITFGRGIVAQRLTGDIAKSEMDVARIVARAQASGSVSAAVAPNFVAHVLFSLHRVEIRRCLDQRIPDLVQSLADLREQFELIFTGLCNHEAGD